MMRVVLTVSTSDSSGGAGIQGDIKTLQAHGVYGASVIVNMAAENTVNIQQVFPVPPEFVGHQFDAVCADLTVDAVKIGGLPTAAHVHAVVAALHRHGLRQIVIEPTIFGTNGDTLGGADVIAPCRQDLFPLAACLCPNRFELCHFLETELTADVDDLVAGARRLVAEGAEAVLVTGGFDDAPEAVDLLVTARDVQRFAAPRSRGRHRHGSGCALTSAIAAGLAQGLSLPEAVGTAKLFVTEAIMTGSLVNLGQGVGPVNHMARQPKSPWALRSPAAPSRPERLDAI